MSYAGFPFDFTKKSLLEPGLVEKMVNKKGKLSMTGSRGCKGKRGGEKNTGTQKAKPFTLTNPRGMPALCRALVATMALAMGF